MAHLSKIRDAGFAGSMRLKRAVCLIRIEVADVLGGASRVCRCRAHTHARMETHAVDQAEWARTRGMRRMRAALQSSLLFPALSSFCRLSVRDRELLRELNGPAVFVANHVSAL